MAKKTRRAEVHMVVNMWQYLAAESHNVCLKMALPLQKWSVVEV
jgi:hypothetical protein